MINIKNSQEWHAWFARRRERLKWRLQQAEEAEWNWPSTRRRCEVMRIQDELDALDAEEFIVPSFAEDTEKMLKMSCAS